MEYYQIILNCPMKNVFPKKDVERFERMFDKTEGCWLWKTGGTRHQSFLSQKKFYRAHRVSYLLFVGQIPENLCVCHRCDTPSCVNPKHLFLGTHRENMRDSVRKGRSSRKGAELRETDVIALRKQYQGGGVTQSDLAKKYKITQPWVSQIVNNKVVGYGN